MRIFMIRGARWYKGEALFDLTAPNTPSLKKVLGDHLASSATPALGMHFLVLSTTEQEAIAPAADLTLGVTKAEFLNRLFSCREEYREGLHASVILPSRAQNLRCLFLDIPQTTPDDQIWRSQPGAMVTAYGVDLDPLMFEKGFATWQEHHYQAHA